MMNDNRRNTRSYPSTKQPTRQAVRQPARQPARQAVRQPARRPVRRSSWLKRQFAIRPLPLGLVIALDVLAIIVALLVFSLFHHVLPSREKAVGIVSQRGASTVQVAATQAPVVEQTPAVAQVPEIDTDQTDAVLATAAQPQGAQSDPVGYFGGKFADKFTAGEVLQDATSYRSGNLNITLSTMRENNAQIYLVDFYLKDISCLQTAFANDTFGRGEREHLMDVAARAGSIVAINGDYYGGHSAGIVIRNGTLYRDNEALEMDIGVIYWDGTMKTFSPNEFNAQREIANGAYQAWSFGPELLDENAQAMTSFNSKVKPKNPRTAIGYYEPGHYCFVIVDGRSKESEGLTMAELSSLMNELGCQVAYNLDGGASTELIWGGQRVNVPYKDGRPCTDAVVLVDKT